MKSVPPTILLAALLSAGTAAATAPACGWAQDAEAFRYREPQRDQLLRKLDGSLAQLEAFAEQARSRRLSESESECNAQLQAKLDQALDPLRTSLGSYVPYLYWQGRYQLLKRDDEGALRSLTKVTELDTLHLEANDLLARLHRERGQNDAALKNFRRVALVEGRDAPADRARIVFALRQLVGELETQPDRVLEFAGRLEKLDGLRLPERARLADVAIAQKQFPKALELIRSLPEPDRSLKELAMLRANGANPAERLPKLRFLVNSEEARAKVGEAGIVKFVSEWIEIARAARDWNELTVASGRGLRTSPANPQFLRDFEDSYRNGRERSAVELARAVELYPTSSYLQRKLLEAHLLPHLRAGPNAQLSKSAAKEGELLAARLLALAPQSLDGQFWQAYVLAKRRVFGRADALFSALVARVRAGERPEMPVDEAVFWRESARVKEARGYVSDATSLLTEGIARADNEDAKRALRAQLKRLQKGG